MPFGPRTSPVDKDEEMYACPECDFTCETKAQLKEHYNLHHKI